MLAGYSSLVCIALLLGGIGYLLLRLQQLKKTSAAVQKNEERFTLAVQSTNDGIWDWDARTNEVYFSPRFTELLGYTGHELAHVFGTFESRLHPEDRSHVLQQIRDHVERKVPFVVEYRLRTKNGEYRWFHSRGQAAWDERSQPIRMAGSIREVTERRQAEEQLRTSASVLAASTAQIMHSLTQLLTSTTEAVSAVSQTASTVEEVKQTAYASGQKAKEVTENAQQTAAITQSGEHAVDAAIIGMRQVREHIESIAHSVIVLSEQSQTIGDIIATVHDLAEQSALLAVNAAIEAARAGEHGKGFGIVAREVKNLAAQSKQATAQIRTILNDVQKATHTAVLVTEQGTKAIEVGVTQSIEANQSIHTLSQSIAAAAQAVTQIAASSQQQVIGMEQAALAMANVKLASGQNLDGLRQIETAVQRLHGVGQTLKALVEQYTGRNDNGGEHATHS